MLKFNNLTFQEQSILSTLTFFDIFNYPLTVFEIYKWLYQSQISNLKSQINISNLKSDSDAIGVIPREVEGSHNDFQLKISEIQTLLETSTNLKKVIENKNGFYFLKRKKDLVARRRDLYRDAETRWKKLKRVAAILQIVPYVKMIAACNTLPINDFKPESDIDVFIIVKKNRLWLTRFLVTVLVALFGQWRHKKNIAGKICLSFFITDDALDLEKIAKKPYDIYLTYWVALVAPLYLNYELGIKNYGVTKQSLVKDEACASSLQSNIYQQFLQANYWAKDYLPNFIGFEPVEFERKVKEVWLFKTIRKIGERILNTKFGDWLENVLKKAQKNKMAKNYQSACRKGGSDVIISDQMLKFHEIDRRDEFRERFELKLEEILGEMGRI